MNERAERFKRRIALVDLAGDDAFPDKRETQPRDDCAALARRSYARQHKDVEVDVWMTEIRRRAEVRIGELSRELDKAQRGDGPAGTFALPDGRKSKTQALADAGISTSTAHEYEQLTGGADARGEAAAKRAIEETLAKGFNPLATKQHGVWGASERKTYVRAGA